MDLTSFTVRGKKYADYFPRYFAEYHKPGTGPECPNCSFHGRIHGIFVGYCRDCALYQYKGYRGPGMDCTSTTESIFDQIDENRRFFMKKVNFVSPRTPLTRTFVFFVSLGLAGVGLLWVWMWLWLRLRV